MIKYLAIGVAIVAVYFVFIKDPYPSSINFQGRLLDVKENNNNSNLKDMDVISYRDKVNQHVLMFAKVNDSGASIAGITRQYLARFESQGVTFQESDGRLLGKLGDQMLYLTEAKSIEALIVYIVQGDENMPTRISAAGSIFRDLESFYFE